MKYVMGPIGIKSRPSVAVAMVSETRTASTEYLALSISCDARCVCGGVCGGNDVCGVVWCGVVWCGVVWCGVVWCGVVWCGVVKCG